MAHHEKIKAFVQQTLGCGCPEEVFYSIDYQSNIKVNDQILLRDKIIIGKRLLIYVVEVNNTDYLNQTLPFLFDIGKKERDEKGFNRFRLVVAADAFNEIKQVAENIFKNIEKDEKVHLHFVLKNSTPVFSDV